MLLGEGRGGSESDEHRAAARRPGEQESTSFRLRHPVGVRLRGDVEAVQAVEQPHNVILYRLRGPPRTCRLDPPRWVDRGQDARVFASLLNVGGLGGALCERW